MSISNRVVKLERFRAELDRSRALNEERRLASSEGDQRRLLVHYSDEELDQIIFEDCGIKNASALPDEELRRLVNR